MAKPKPAQWGWLDVVRAAPGLSAPAAQLATELATYMNSETLTCWPSIDTLAKSMRRGPNTVKRAVRELEAAGLIQVDRQPSGAGQGHPNQYRAIVEKGPAQTLSEVHEKGPGRTQKGPGRTSKGSVVDPEQLTELSVNTNRWSANDFIDHRPDLWNRAEAVAAQRSGHIKNSPESYMVGIARNLLAEELRNEQKDTARRDAIDRQSGCSMCNEAGWLIDLTGLPIEPTVKCLHTVAYAS